MKSSKISILLLFIICFSCSSDLSYEQQVKDYNFYVKKSDSLIGEKNYREAMRYVNSAIDITDTIPIAIYLKGYVSYELDLLEDAEENFSEAIKLEGKMSKTYKDRAKVYLKMGDNDFLDDINTHLENYPSDEEAHELRRNYLEDKEDYDEAISEYNLAIDKNKNDISLLTKRADLYYKNGDHEKSIQDLERILKLNPNDETIKVKRDDISSLMNKNSNRNILLAILISSYVIYLLISFFILKPLVKNKAINQVGGNFKITSDPLIWVLPIVLVLIFLGMYFTDLIPNFQ